MDTYIDICGTPIDVAKIKDFRIVQREFIYRPMYKEAEKSVLNLLANKKYVFFSMQPYAAICAESSRKPTLGDYKAKDFKEAVGKDLFDGVVTTIADKFNIKAFKYNKYQCVNLAGRIFTTYLDDVPAILIRNDGKASEVHKGDELYSLLGETISPVIELVPALEIRTNELFIFYGNSIQLEDVQAEYERLKAAVAYLRNLKGTTKLADKKSKFSLPTLPRIQLNGKSSDDMCKNALDDETICVE